MTTTKERELRERYGEMYRLIHTLDGKQGELRLARSVRDHGYMTHALAVAKSGLEVIELLDAFRAAVMREINDPSVELDEFYKNVEREARAITEYMNESWNSW